MNWFWGPQQFSKYKEFTDGLIDACGECGGQPFYQEVNIDQYVIACDGCDQCIGPSKDRNQLGWDWNKEQRKNGNKVSHRNRKRRRKR